MSNTNISAYDWLCSTIKTYDPCSSDVSNMVGDDEATRNDLHTSEAYGMFGLKLTYYKIKEDLKRDVVYGEDQLRYIERSWYFDGYVNSIPPNVRTYELQGIWGEDLVTVYCGIAAFNYFSTYGESDKNTPEIYDKVEPCIGDIIYFQANDMFYEIRDVKYYDEAFGMKSHTYTLSLKVYKDMKVTIDTSNPTLSNTSDPIYRVAPDTLSGQYNINDVLKINDEVKKERWSDVLYDEKNNKENVIDPFYGW